ncbi:hypothetical protein D9758_003869 [Tetrapyrgos nigripes]|uniref:AB hydrolase-1 domain-containing protein n=1 Tax=Tetrapyrgos nigripes TaxID=182062 RepID=A0A8H5GL58_9AGAR|nr:hypothetical protein D9758_003869 [Tetrapyrgos nigripes]
MSVLRCWNTTHPFKIITKSSATCCRTNLYRVTRDTLRVFSSSTNAYAPSTAPQAESELKPIDLAYAECIPSDGNRTDRAVVIIHGLYGFKRNWTSLSKAFSKDLNRPVYALDLRNHGESPHATPMTYPQMALDVSHFVKEHKLEKVTVIGHSMGGKVAMTLTLGRYLPSSTLANLVVADIAPIKGRVSRASVSYIDAMRKIDSLKLKTRKEAKEVLSEWEKDPSTQAFLLTNLILPSDTSEEYARFGIPLDILSDAIPDIGTFPYEPGEIEPWEGRTLFVKGERSKFLNSETLAIAKKFFPQLELKSVDAGHWVHGERPNEFKKHVVDFIKAGEQT